MMDRPRAWFPVNLLKPLADRLPTANTFGQQVRWTMGANLGMTLTGMLTGLMAARLLGPQGRGEMAAIQSWVFLIASLATLGMTEAVIFFISRSPKETGAYLFTAHLLTVISGLVFAAAGWWLMPWLLAAQTAAVMNAARFFLLMMIPLFGLFSYYEALRATGRWRTWNMLRVLPNLLWMVILGCAFVLPLMANAVLLSLLFPVVFLVQVIPSLGVLLRQVSATGRLNVNLVRPLMGYGIPTTLSVLPRTLNLRLDQMLMAGFLAPQSLGLYAAAVAWSGASTGVFAAIGQVLFPRLSGMLDRGSQKAELSRAIRVTILFDMALTGGLLALTPWCFPFLFGPDFASAVPFALVLVGANGFVNVNATLASGLQGLGLPRKILVAEILGLVVTVCLLFLLLPRMGTMGAALASLAAYAVISLAMSISISRFSGLPEFEAQEMKPEVKSDGTIV
jgi:enterobacterial common antigen flippase